MWKFYSTVKPLIARMARIKLLSVLEAECCNGRWEFSLLMILALTNKYFIALT
jgi:hypothetical protein